MPIVSDDSNENEFEERATLTQRRQVGGSSKLNRAKLEPIKTSIAEDAKEGSSGKIVIWVVAVITIAAAAYFGIKSFINKPATVGTTPTVAPSEVLPTLSVAEQIMSNTVLANATASNVRAASFYTTTNKQVGTVSDAEYTITDLSVQKFASFTRFSYTLTGEFPANITTTPGATVAPFPVVTATYNTTNNTISLLFSQIASNMTAFSTAGSVSIGTPSILRLTHDLAVPNEQDKYVIELNTLATYDIQALTASNNIIVDVTDVKPVTTTVVPTTSTTPTITATVSVTPTTTASVSVTPVAGSRTEFSRGNQTITSTLASNTFNMVGGYRYAYPYTSTATGETYTGMFSFEKTLLGTTYPNVSASLSGTTLTVLISNYQTSSSTEQTVTFNSNGIVSGLKASVTNHVLSYVFTLVKETDYRLIFDTEHLVLLIQMKS